MVEVIYRRERDLLDFLRDYLRKHGYAPTLREMARALGVSSVATVHKHLKALEKKGFLKRHRGWRGLEVIEERFREELGVSVPFYGPVPAGHPKMLFGEASDTLEVPEWMVGRKREVFALQVEGDSMIDAYVKDGDMVLVERTDTAESGEIVVALLPEGEITLKRLKKGKDSIFLVPENPQYPPIKVKEVQILGKVIGILRRYR